jgi:hypothetical protein
MNIFFKFLTLATAIIISPVVALAIATVSFFMSIVGFINGAVDALTKKPALEEPEEELGVWEKYAKELEKKSKDN